MEENLFIVFEVDIVSGAFRATALNLSMDSNCRNKI
jgi:hypothetical protein